ncbi:MAG: TonB-dependent receptor, partial [Candidatus Aminicenantales bacterium]
MKNRILAFLAIILLLAPIAFSQSRDTGAIRGVVTDDQGAPLPGVNVTLSGGNLMGVRTFVTDPSGEFRFPALPPGVYEIKAELQGFGTVIREKIRLTTTSTLAVDFQLKPSAVTEEVTVIAQSPTVDVKSTETASVTLSNEILRNIPYSQFTSDIVNMAPGVNNDSAYGASSGTGVAYTMDGVGVGDPDAGTAWVFLDHNIIEEAKIMGVGLPAEYGNFTGVIFNLVTKSGGNTFAGHIEFNRQMSGTKFWQANNNSAYVTDFPDLTSPSSNLFDINVHLGGPIIKDKLWFYAGGQYYRSKDRPSGFPEDVDYKQPRGFLKLTSQLTPSLNLSASLEIDQYKGINRAAGSNVDVNATINQSSPEKVGNFSLTQIFSPKTFFDLKGAFFSGYYYLEPEVGRDVYMHFDYADNRRHDSAGYFYLADRSRYQANASLTHYVEDFIAGSHDFKFGAEIERSYVRSRYGYPGYGGPLGNNVAYYDYTDYYVPGVSNYLAYQYGGYDKNTRYTRLEGFVQDAWQVSKRLNISLGVRLSQYWGQVKNVSGNVYSAARIAPRLGFTFDILGDKTTILKGHYGQFSEAMNASYHDQMNPSSAFKDRVSYYWDIDTSEWVEFERIVHNNLYTMDPNVKHPYMEQFTLGIERELFKDASFGVTYINRSWKNIIGPVDRAADYDTITQTVSGYGDYTVYERTPETVNTFDYLITNYQVGDNWILANPYRKYSGLEFLFNKRFSSRWQLVASYVYSKTHGTIDNGTADDINYGGGTNDPNFYTNS